MSIDPKGANGAEELITTGEAAKILRVGRTTIRRYIEAGHLKATRLPGGKYRIWRSSVIDLRDRGIDQ